MRLQLTVDGDADATEQLRRFLEADPDVQRFGDLRYGRPEEREHLGVDLQVLSIAVTGTLTTAGLVLQLLNFRRTKPAAPPVFVLTRELPDGTVLRLELHDPALKDEVIRRLEGG
ncbi:hypothetical protein Q0Z83_044940 [Actinoplanes sichuanensis]|uniref:Uncharacterized protein n=1 Tax=Actinoplanes sichuanensis TaxID=512349 RepID=A0ABW4AR83_9ACTN|nr:hypothetical protein [Actinoplanes sichuanensis]BEL06303.1 hypothetical protein Q0Z83_044940 [Actinoplanes sichuanensis]